MPHLDELTAEVDRTKTVTASVLALVAGLATKIEENKADPAALQTLANDLRSTNNALAAAVIANTTPTPPNA